MERSSSLGSDSVYSVFLHITVFLDARAQDEELAKIPARVPDPWWSGLLLPPCTPHLKRRRRKHEPLDAGVCLRVLCVLVPTAVTRSLI